MESEKYSDDYSEYSESSEDHSDESKKLRSEEESGKDLERGTAKEDNKDEYADISEWVSIFVIGLGLRSVHFHVSIDECAFGLKQKIEKCFGIPVCQQILWHGNTPIGNRKLSEYGVRQHSNIDLQVRLVGGHPSILGFSDMSREDRWTYFSEYQSQLKELKAVLSEPCDEISREIFEKFDYIKQTGTLINLQAHVIYSNGLVQAKNERERMQKEPEVCQAWLTSPTLNVGDWFVGMFSGIYLIGAFLLYLKPPKIEPVGFSQETVTLYANNALIVCLVVFYWCCRLSPRINYCLTKFVAKSTFLCAFCTIPTYFALFKKND